MPPAVVERGVRDAEGWRRAAPKARTGTNASFSRLTDISVPAFDADSPDSRKRIADTMRRSLTEDLLAQYVTRLQTDLGATINMDAVRRSVSGSSADQN